MSRFRLRVSPGFIMLLAALYLTDSGGWLSALAVACAAHELGHLACLWCAGGRAESLELRVMELRIGYSGCLGYRGELAVAAAGPVTGLLFALLCARLGAVWSSRFLLCAAGASLLLTGYNLLPALPLDGGRLLWWLLLMRGAGEGRARRVLCFSGALCALGLISAGLVFWPGGAALAAAGAALIPALVNCLKRV